MYHFRINDGKSSVLTLDKEKNVKNDKLSNVIKKTFNHKIILYKNAYERLLMEEKNDKNDKNDVVNKTQSETKININKHIEELQLRPSDEAGPSNVIDLPGTINPGVFNKTGIPGISKSEVNIRQILTNNEGGTTIALTSLSFGNQRVIPQEDNIQNIIDLNKFITSCFNTEKTVKEIINIPVIITENLQTEQQYAVAALNEEVENRNESGAIVPKVGTVSKVASDSSKRKTSGDISQRSGMGLTQRDSLSSIGSNVCRICMTRGREKLISPCNCKGSLANVHLSCLERWLNQVGRNHCELCGFSYPAIRTPRYTVLQALRLWFGNPRNRSHLQSDCLIFWLLSTVTAGLLAVCVVGTQYFVIEGKKIGKHDGAALRKDEGGISHRITETAMNFFMAIVLCGYFVTVYLLWKDHYVMWNRWRRANVNVRLLLTPDSNPVPFIPRSEYNI